MPASYSQNRPIALITGATKNIGRAIAIDCIKQGFHTIIHYRQNDNSLQSLKIALQQIGGSYQLQQANLNDSIAIEQLVDAVAQCGRLDVLVNNVGNYLLKPLIATDPSELLELLQVNVIAAFKLNQALLPYLKQSRGQIIHFGCANLHDGFNFKAPAYHMTKTLLLQMTKALATECGQYGVRVNMISPGQQDHSVDAPHDVQTAIPLGRLGTHRDLISALHYLLQPNSYVTGLNLEVTGGYRYKN